MSTAPALHAPSIAPAALAARSRLHPVDPAVDLAASSPNTAGRTSPISPNTGPAVMMATTNMSSA